MGKVYIGVMAVGGHKLWGVVGGKRVAGLGGLGEMGERWKIDGRRRGGCGPGMPGPYGAMERSGRAGINFRRVSLSPNLYTSVTCFPLM